MTSPRCGGPRAVPGPPGHQRRRQGVNLAERVLGALPGVGATRPRRPRRETARQRRNPLRSADGDLRVADSARSNDVLLTAEDLLRQRDRNASASPVRSRCAAPSTAPRRSSTTSPAACRCWGHSSRAPRASSSSRSPSGHAGQPEVEPDLSPGPAVSGATPTTGSTACSVRPIQSAASAAASCAGARRLFGH